MKKFSKNVNRILGKAGFTLVELLVVMAILGILIAVAIAGISIAQKGARDNTRIRDWTSIKGALETCYGAVKRYPTNAEFSQPTTTTIRIGGVTSYNCDTTVQLQQSGSTILLTKGATGCTATGQTGVYAADANQWAIGYNQTGNGSSYDLCVKLENGSLYFPQ